MSESLFSHIILCESLSFSQGKTRPTNLDERSKFLSSLALVLNGNATCTAVFVHQAEKIVYIARNEAITTVDQRYFDRFFRQIRTYAHLCFDKNKKVVTLEAQDQLESLVFEYNSKKIIKRFLGQHPMMIDELRQMTQWNMDEKKPFIEELRSNSKLYRECPSITEKIHLISINSTEEDYVQYLLETLKRFLVARDLLVDSQINPTDQQLILATALAKTLYQSYLFRYILDHSNGTAATGVHYFKKISAHKRSINLLLKYLLKRKDFLTDLYQNISWKMVSSIEETRALSITPRKAFEQIFIQLSHSLNQNISNASQNISIDIIFDQHLRQLKRFDNDPNHRVHLHAEILLIDYLLKMNINETNQSKEVEIGISKLSCLLCSFYIDQLNRKYDRCFCTTNSTNGKIYSKWTYRANEDQSILNRINEKLTDKLQQSIQKLCLDSHRTNLKKNGDSDIMFTSIEEDEFDLDDDRKCER